MGSRQPMIAGIVLLGITLLWGADSTYTVAQQATPQAAGPVAISSEVLGRAEPASVAIPELSLGRVTVMPGAVLPVHKHPGTQIGAIVQGELTYSVFTGEIAWYQADGPPGEPRMIQPGETVVVRPGDALVESPESIHQGRNTGGVPLMIYLSTLFPVNAPRAIVVEATPIP